MRYREEDELRVFNTHNSCKIPGGRKPANYDRPGRITKMDKRYRSGATHTGKGKTLRDKRKNKWPTVDGETVFGTHSGMS